MCQQFYDAVKWLITKSPVQLPNTDEISRACVAVFDVPEPVGW